MIVVHMLNVTMADVFATMDTSVNTMNVSKQVSLAGVMEDIMAWTCLKSVNVFRILYKFGD